MTINKKDFLLLLYAKAVEVSQPQSCLPPFLSNFDPSQKTCILGAGKAAADMAAQAYKHFKEACYGAVVTRYGYETDLPTGNIKVLSAAHPVPDENSMLGGQALLELAKNKPEDIPVIFLISGGGSALAAVPCSGVSLAEKISVHKFLLRSGANILEMNTVRKHLSSIKGGRLAAACKGKKHSLVISDVVGDDPTYIASGMTVQDNSSAQQALAILLKYGWTGSNTVTQSLLNRAAPPVVDGQYTLIANANKALDAAKKMAQQQGVRVEIISYSETGEACEVAKKHAAIAMKHIKLEEPVLLLSGGELTVSLGDSKGQGGPNQEYLLALAIELEHQQGFEAIAADTDGVDGSKDVAGAYINDETLKMARQSNLNATEYLQEHNSFAFFDSINAHIAIGPTGTNVNDFRAIWVH